MNNNKEQGHSIVDQFTYFWVYGLMYSLSLLPMRVLYWLSDFIYLLVYRIAKYRVALVRKNLSSSFPQKSQEELRDIEKQFYGWFCDYIVETIKLTSISEEEIKRRVTYEGMDIIQKAHDKGKSVTLYMGHYCNWEWLTSIALHLPKDIAGGQLYHALNNSAMDRIFLKIRERFGSKCIRMDKTMRTLVSLRKQNICSCTGYIADQVPGYGDMHCWPFFLNHDTPVYTGPEKMSRLLDCTMVYLDITRPKRGYYHCKLVTITDDIKNEADFKPTLTFYAMLEKSINDNPPYWLWTHNRWKRTREEFNKIYTEEQRKIILSRL